MNYESIKEDLLSLNKSTDTDVINNKFEIDTSASIDALSNEFCDFYSATDISDDKNGYFAIVFKDNFYIPSRILVTLKENSYIDDGISMVTPVDYGITEISTKDSWHFVVIVHEYYYTEILSNYINTSGTLTYEEILEQLIIPFTKLIKFCKDNKIPCGNINPDNIILQDGHLLLREVFIAPGNFYQPNEYIPLELLESIEYGRIPYSHKSDLYALGIITYYAYTGITVHEKIKDYDQDRMIHGTLKTLTSGKNISMQLRGILRHILEDNFEKRCNVDDLIKLVKTNEIPPTNNESNIINIDAISFNKTIYKSLRHFAYGLFCHWNEAVKFLGNQKLLKQIQEYTNINISELSKVNTNNFNNSYHDKISYQEQLLITLLHKIDPHASIRLKNFAISPNNIIQAIFYAINQNNKGWLHNIVYIIKNSYWDNYTKESLDYVDYDELLGIFSHLQASSNIPEYILVQNIYLCNPFLPCNSNILDGKYIITIEEFLEALEQEPEKIIIDSNITAFLKSRIMIYNKVLEEFHYTNTVVPYSKIFNDVFIISEAQKIANLEQIENIVEFFGNKIFNHLIKYINNNKLKDMLKNQIISIIEENDLENILSLINNNNLFNNDYNGFLDAQRRIDEIDKEIASLYSYDKVYKGLILKGRKLTMVFSCLLCIFIFFIIFLFN